MIDTSESQTTARPEMLDAWWDAIDEELAALPANPEFTFEPLQSNDDATVYTVRMSSAGSYPIAAWMSVPAGEGPFPAFVTPVTYASVVTPAHVDIRRRFVTMTMKTRGQRGADKPYAAAYPGHLTEGIDDPDTWIFRGVMADMLRAYEVLRDHPAVDADRIGISGSDAGLLLNARRPGAAAVQVTAPFWYRLAEMADSSDDYPIEEINDYRRTFPERRDAVAQTLALVDPQFQADRVTAAVQINRDQEGRFANDAWLSPLVSSIDSEVAYFDVTHEGQTDHDANDAWMAGRLGVEPVARTWQGEERGPWR